MFAAKKKMPRSNVIFTAILKTITYWAFTSCTSQVDCEDSFNGLFTVINQLHFFLLGLFLFFYTPYRNYYANRFNNMLGAREFFS